MAESAAYNVGAGIANVFYIPGKGLLCGVGVATGIFILLVSIGSAPRPAAYFAREGCGGKWVRDRGGDELGGQARGDGRATSPRASPRTPRVPPGLGRRQEEAELADDPWLGRGRRAEVGLGGLAQVAATQQQRRRQRRAWQRSRRR